MKIALVGPSPVPYAAGGTENLLWGLCETINKSTKHQAELIKLPSRELSFWELIESYYAYYKLDLSHFDLVISTKYPSWMVQHNNSICYMIHTLRGLYDTYHMMHQPLEVERGNVYVDAILDYMDNGSSIQNLDTFFGMVFDLRNHESEIPGGYFAFPAPFIRKIVHFMDKFALSRSGVKKIYAISENVKNRTDYYPAGTKVSVIYPPTTLKDATCDKYEYVFMISRLDAPKRIDMLINAMKYVKSNVKLLIAGKGPQMSELKKLAAGDKRIQFLGYVSDEMAEKYYANSLVIPYFPYDEDYGLITLEAMLHKKPVITTTDAGGPNEFVKNGETGFVTSFDAKKIAKKIEYFANNPKEAKRMGENAYQSVKDITWENQVNMLLEGCEDFEKIVPKENTVLTTKAEDRNTSTVQEKQKNVTVDRRQKMTVVSTFPIYPPVGGGQARTYSLYKGIARYFDVDIVSFTNTDQLAFEAEIGPNIREIRTPKTEKHQQEEWALEQKIGIPVSDIGALTLSRLTPAYSEKLRQSVQESDYVVLSHPYLYQEVMNVLGKQKIIYEAQDVESVIKDGMLPDSKHKKDVIRSIYEVEKKCCEMSEYVLTCSEEDKKKIHEIYNVPMKKILVAPNGVDTSETVYTGLNERIRNKEVMGLQNEKVGLFMGSWHQPNLDSCEVIFEVANNNPDVRFMLMGSQCMYYANKEIPSNVALLGVVDEKDKNRIFSVVDFALNPMMSGSGTNLKMFDYMAAGIPIISTEFGMRGIEERGCFIKAENGELSKAIKEFSLFECGEMVEKARKHVVDTFDWNVIVQNLMDVIKK